MARALLCLVLGCSALALPCRQQLGFVAPASARPRPRRVCDAAAISRRAAAGDGAPAAGDDPPKANETEASFFGALFGGRAAAEKPSVGLWDVLRDPAAFMEDDD